MKHTYFFFGLIIYIVKFAKNKDTVDKFSTHRKINSGYYMSGHFI